MVNLLQENMSFEASEEDKKHFDEKGYILVRFPITKTERADFVCGVTQDMTSLEWWHDPKGCRNSQDDRIYLQLLGGEVYHYRSKLMMKEAQTVGSFVWHQDYGYWYYNGILRPQMLTVFTALDATDTGNGCLKVHDSVILECPTESDMTGKHFTDPNKISIIKVEAQSPPGKRTSLSSVNKYIFNQYVSKR